MEKESVSDVDDGLYPDEPFVITAQSSNEDLVEKGEGSGVVFAREAPLIVGNHHLAKRSVDVIEKGSLGKEKKLSRQDRIELGRLFQSATSSQDWELSERMVDLADLQTLNDLLCISLDSIWFLTTEGELRGITGLIAKIICHGAHDYTRATLRTSFLASCVSSCRNRTVSLSDSVTVMAQR